jgi:hypothetical protein
MLWAAGRRPARQPGAARFFAPVAAQEKPAAQSEMLARPIASRYRYFPAQKKPANRGLFSSGGTIWTH